MCLFLLNIRQIQEVHVEIHVREGHVQDHVSLEFQTVEDLVQDHVNQEFQVVVDHVHVSLEFLLGDLDQDLLRDVELLPGDQELHQEEKVHRDEKNLEMFLEKDPDLLWLKTAEIQRNWTVDLWDLAIPGIWQLTN